MTVTLRFQPTGVMPGNAAPAVLRGGSLTIGRAAENDLVLPDPERQLSKQHCVIEERDGAVVLIDFSSNGTFVNYAKMPAGRQPTALHDGDILSLGGFELLVSITPGAGPVRAPAEIPDPLPEDPAGINPYSLLAPMEDPLRPDRAPQGLPEAPEEVDFLDSLLGAAPPRGHREITRAEPGDDGFLPPLGEAEAGFPLAPPPLAEAASQAASQAASLYERKEALQDHFAAPGAINSIPDDWDALLDDPPGAEVPAPFFAAPAPLPEPPPPEPPLSEPPLSEAPAPEAPPAAPAAGALPEEVLTLRADLAEELTDGLPTDLTAKQDPFAEAGDKIAPDGASGSREAPAPAARPEDQNSGEGPSPDLLAAFVRGLGIPAPVIAPEEAAATMERLGRAMRAMVTGLREVLMTRASIKQEFRIGQTVIAAGGNNPLKFSVTPEAAIEAMLRPHARGWLPADQAADQALQDMKAHEVAMLTGMEAALKDLLKRLDPAVLEAKLEARGGISGFLKGRKARYWELYETLYSEISDQAENEFQELFAREFARAYRAQLERLK